MENYRNRVEPKLVSSDPSDKYELSAEQLKFYNDNGYLVINQLIDFSTLYSCKQRFLQIAKGIVPKNFMTIVKEPALVAKKLNPEDYVNKIQDILYDDVFAEYVVNPRLYHVVTQLIGDDVTGIHSMFINKPPGTGRHPPHQDIYYFPHRPADKIVAAWTAVDHVTMENGCLYVLSGSHKGGQIHEHGPQQDTMMLYHGILDEEQVAPMSRRVHVEMSPGDTVFFHPHLVHGSGPNVSQNYRKAITFHFAHTDCELIDVSGTVQQEVAKEVEASALKRGFQLTFQEVWQAKSRRVTDLKSHL